jgi:hypothetical protein
VPSSIGTNREYLTRSNLAKFLTNNGYPVSPSTLAKLCAPARGEGPPAAGVWLGRPFYDPAKGLAWARSRFRKTELTRGRRGARPVRRPPIQGP